MQDASEVIIYEYLRLNDVDDASAKEAAHRCARAAHYGALRTGVEGYFTGAVGGIALAEAGVATGGAAVAAAILLGAAGALGGAYQSARQCLASGDVQDLVEQINSDSQH